MSKLFYQTRLERPELDRAEGIYMWDKSGKRYIDGSSGAMVSNIGHSNPAVLHAMQKHSRKKGCVGMRPHIFGAVDQTLPVLPPAPLQRTCTDGAAEIKRKALNVWSGGDVVVHGGCKCGAGCIENAALCIHEILRES